MVVNVLESEVRSALDEYFATGYDGCTCDQCKNDIMAITLNQLTPQYSASQTGEAFIKAKLMADQLKIDILHEMTVAAEIVKKNQHHRNN
jgi:competence protein ComFB